nr:MAG TPA: hypothetical protein [Caudoviricetes sp.]DAR82035.1 MAG TPA: hypothetical protein [Caudoviricetes sp.]
MFRYRYIAWTANLDGIFIEVTYSNLSEIASFNYVPFR